MNDITHNTSLPIMGKERRYRFNNSELVIRFGDITESKTDVIVCSDDQTLSASGGTSAAIRAVCGDVVLHDVRKKTNADLGDVVVTTAGNLPHKFLFHCITLKLHEIVSVDSEKKSEREEYIIQHSISKCLRLMTALDLTSIAFPCIGAGYAGFDFERVGRVMSTMISDFLLKTNKTYRIEIFLYGMRDGFDMMDYIAFFEQFSLRVPSENGNLRIQAQDSLKKESENTKRAEHEDVDYEVSAKKLYENLRFYLDKADGNKCVQDA